MKMNKEKEAKHLKNAIKANFYWLYVEQGKQNMEEIDKQIDNILECMEKLMDLKLKS